MTETIRRIAAVVWQKVREGWKAVVALATPIVFAALVDIIDAVNQWIQLEYGTSLWVGAATAALVWLKRNVEPDET